MRASEGGYGGWYQPHNKTSVFRHTRLFTDHEEQTESARRLYSEHEAMSTNRDIVIALVDDTFELFRLVEHCARHIASPLSHSFLPRNLAKLLQLLYNLLMLLLHTWCASSPTRQRHTSARLEFG